jgi:hypothetical protein
LWFIVVALIMHTLLEAAMVLAMEILGEVADITPMSNSSHAIEQVLCHRETAAESIG